MAKRHAVALGQELTAWDQQDSLSSSTSESARAMLAAAYRDEATYEAPQPPPTLEEVEQARLAKAKAKPSPPGKLRVNPNGVDMRSPDAPGSAVAYR